jgi:methylenetetrahydrofolate dehydrogenase (NADP+)/methenyltetrahydrofolate cyclohydrolase
MVAKILDGAALAASMRKDIGVRARHFTAQHGRMPGLAVILVGDDAASRVYVRNKVKACHEAGIFSWLKEIPAEANLDTVLAAVRRFNEDHAVDGILVQLPLPKQIDTQRVIEAIAPSKDVDGLQIHSAGALMTGQLGFLPCTPFGIMKMLEHTNTKLAGAEAVVLGRSVSVGKPMGMMLLAADATVTFCHSKTRQLAEVTSRADILIAAVGRAKVVTADMVKPGAVVIDVGINRAADGKLVGDVDFDAVRDKASWLSPVPGGVGPMTITMLLDNTLRSVERSLTGN